MLDAKTVGVTRIPRVLGYILGISCAGSLTAIFLVTALREFFAPLFEKALSLSSEPIPLFFNLMELDLKYYAYWPLAIVTVILVTGFRFLNPALTKKTFVKDLTVTFAILFVVAPLIYPHVKWAGFNKVFKPPPLGQDADMIAYWLKVTSLKVLLPVFAGVVSAYGWLYFRHLQEKRYPELIPGVAEEIRKTCLYHLLAGDYDESVRQAYITVEEALRRKLQRSGIQNPAPGLGKMWIQAFGHPSKRDESGVLGSKLSEDEKQGVKSLGLGAASFFRNPTAHSRPGRTREEAIVGIYLADLLLKIIERAEG